jgi:ferric-dicitrate binding protein FerR (iron transport regulator)
MHGSYDAQGQNQADQYKIPRLQRVRRRRLTVIVEKLQKQKVSGVNDHERPEYIRGSLHEFPYRTAQKADETIGEVSARVSP